MIGGDVLDRYSLNSERLEQEGIVMRCGLTPTDAMHIRGDYACFDAEASRLVALYFVRAISAYDGMENAVETLSEDIYNLVKKRLFENIARVFIEAAYPKLFKGGISDQMTSLISDKWKRRSAPKDETFFDLGFNVSASLIGLGAPTHIFLPDVAKVLGVKCIIPEHSEVANAIGAAAAEVAARVTVEVHPVYTSEGVDGYGVHAPGVNEKYEGYAEAVEVAKAAAARLAAEEARRRGASDVTAEVSVVNRTTRTRTGSELKLGAVVQAIAGHRRGECKA
jgi:N-methylhydantoinase A/oxoprolinase/acetone carboxylase beta subunit